MPFDALAHHGITGLAFCRRQSHCGIRWRDSLNLAHDRRARSLSSVHAHRSRSAKRVRPVPLRWCRRQGCLRTRPAVSWSIGVW